MKIFSPILKGTTTVAQGTTNLSGSFTGSLFGTAATASYADNFTVGGTLTAQTINVQIITSSIEFNTGSTRNGALLTNTHEFTGSVLMTGSLTVTTTGTELQVNAGGVNIGNALTDNHIISGSLRVNTNALFVSSSGNIGIGTVSPLTNLMVGDGAIQQQPYLSLARNATGGFFAGVRWYDGTTIKSYIQEDADFNLRFGTSNSERMRITPTGNVEHSMNDGGISLYKADRTTLKASIANPDGSNTDEGGLFLYKANATKVQIRANGVSYFSGGNVGIGTTSPNSKLSVNGTTEIAQSDAASVISLFGNGNNQGSAQNYKIVRHYPVVSSGNKLILPFISQGNLNSTTIVRVFGHAARFNSNIPYGFTADFAVGHLNQLLNLSTFNSTGNISGIAINGMNIEISFTNAYTAATANGIFVTIEFMTSNASYSINIANIAMN
jgi:hypothetical protein